MYSVDFKLNLVWLYVYLKFIILFITLYRVCPAICSSHCPDSQRHWCSYWFVTQRGIHSGITGKTGNWYNGMSFVEHSLYTFYSLWKNVFFCLLMLKFCISCLLYMVDCFLQDNQMCSILRVYSWPQNLTFTCQIPEAWWAVEALGARGKKWGRGCAVWCEEGVGLNSAWRANKVL